MERDSGGFSISGGRECFAKSRLRVKAASIAEAGGMDANHLHSLLVPSGWLPDDPVTHQTADSP